MTGAVDGPFDDFRDKHGVTSATFRSEAATLHTAHEELQALGVAVRARVRTARFQTEGYVATLLNPEEVPAAQSSDRMAGAALFSAACLRQWADHVDDFDASVSTLNSTFHDRVEERFTRAGNTQTWQEIRSQVVAQLTPQYAGHEQDLEADGQQVAGTLSAGPDSESLSQMLDAGLIPLSALGLFGSVTIDAEVLATARARAMMDELIDEGLLDGPVDEDSHYFRWLLNAGRRDVSTQTILDVARDHGITPEDFEILADLEEMTDRDGKSFFLLPDDISGDDARRAVLMTYIFNAGTDYGDATDQTGTENDFEETPYSSEEVQRIIDRQDANGWSYSMDVGFVHGNGGRMVTTPNGIMMGLGGNWIQNQFSLRGGTMWGEIFMTNVDDPEDEVQMLEDIIERGTKPTGEGPGSTGALDLDRLLHHEERHARQWAEEGYLPYADQYLTEELLGIFGKTNKFEDDAGLADGGYR